MPRKAKAFVLDSWAVLAYLGDEASAQQVADLISKAHEDRIPMYMSVINAGEVWYVLAREVSEADADDAAAELLRLGIQLVEVDWPLARVAASYKSQHKMSYADCYAAALAKNLKSQLVTGDKEFRQIEGQIAVHWL